MKAEQLASVAKGFPVPLPSAATAWGYSPKSSSINSVVGALNQYGLLEDEGAGDSRRVKLSALGEAILLDKRPDSKARKGALVRAALSPKVFQELWEQYQTGDVDEGTLQYDLTLGRKTSGKAPFSETAALDVARKYRETLEFAGLDSVDVDPDQVTDNSSEQLSERPSTVESVNEGRSIEASPAIVNASSDTQFEERKALDEGAAVLVWPRDLSPDSVEDMEYWLEGVLRQIRRRASRAT